MLKIDNTVLQVNESMMTTTTTEFPFIVVREREQGTSELENLLSVCLSAIGRMAFLAEFAESSKPALQWMVTLCKKLVTLRSI